ncbi:TPA: DUF551 domain-containing protein [Escherichia coli]|nr:DUF551 domain-containing protein [Escherichia coli]
MTTITKERLLTIKQWRETYGPGSNVVLPAEEAEELARIALASLEAEPVAYIFKHPAGKLFWALTDESNKEQPDVIPVYADSPAPVVPDNASEPLAYAYKELTPEIMRNHLAVFERYGIAPNDSSTTIQALRIALDGIERSDTMLQAGNFRENKDSSTNNFRETSETSTNSPVIPDGLSTVCAEAYQVVGVMADALGVFGDAAVQKVLDNLSQQKLVHRDVLPFSLPVTPDGWISCSERMPKKNQNVLISVNFDSDLVEPLICSARYTGSTFRRGKATIKPGNGIEQATHWMPLPEPPQGVNDELA